MLVIFGPFDNTALLFGMILSLTLLKGPRNTSRNHWSTVNTICRAICRCQLKLYDAKKKPYVNLVQKRRHVMWAKANLKWTVSKWKSVICQKSGQTSPNLKFLFEIMDAVSPRLKRRENFQRVVSIRLKIQHV